MIKTSLVHDIPNTFVQRVVFTLMGAFVFFIVPYDLGRGIWPFNLLTPVFTVFVGLGMGLGALLIYAGLISPSLEYEFSPKGLLIKSQFLRGNSQVFHPIANVTGISVIQETNSDGPDNWYAAVNITDLKPLRSRPFGSQATAQDYAAQFRAALGLAG